MKSKEIFTVIALMVLCAIFALSLCSSDDQQEAKRIEDNIESTIGYKLEGYEPYAYLSDRTSFKNVAWESTLYDDVHVKKYDVTTTKKTSGSFDSVKKYAVSGTVMYTGSFSYLTNEGDHAEDHDETRTYGPFDFEATCSVDKTFKVTVDDLKIKDPK